MQNVSVSPAVQLDYGLTDISINQVPTDYKDTLASLGFMVSIKYAAF
jgi:hypothetical protein